MITKEHRIYKMKELRAGNDKFKAMDFYSIKKWVKVIKVKDWYVLKEDILNEWKLNNNIR